MHGTHVRNPITEMPEVVDVGVVGVQDAEYGERPVAFISGAAEIYPAELERRVGAFCETRLGTIKRPVRYVVLPELPRSATGKMRRRELRDMLAARR